MKSSPSGGKPDQLNEEADGNATEFRKILVPQFVHTITCQPSALQHWCGQVGKREPAEKCPHDTGKLMVVGGKSGI